MNHHLRLEVIVSGVYLVVATKFITARKSVPWCWGKMNILGCTDYTIEVYCLRLGGGKAVNGRQCII